METFDGTGKSKQIKIIVIECDKAFPWLDMKAVGILCDFLIIEILFCFVALFWEKCFKSGCNFYLSSLQKNDIWPLEVDSNYHVLVPFNHIEWVLNHQISIYFVYCISNTRRTDTGYSQQFMRLQSQPGTMDEFLLRQISRSVPNRWNRTLGCILRIGNQLMS